MLLQKPYKVLKSLNICINVLSTPLLLKVCNLQTQCSQKEKESKTSPLENRARLSQAMCS